MPPDVPTTVKASVTVPVTEIKPPVKVAPMTVPLPPQGPPLHSVASIMPLPVGTIEQPVPHIIVAVVFVPVVKPENAALVAVFPMT